MSEIEHSEVAAAVQFLAIAHAKKNDLARVNRQGDPLVRNLVQSAKTLVLLGVITAAIVACGRELAAPDQPEVDTGSRPEALALVAQNRYACSIVLWSGDTTHARRSLRFRKTLPASAAAAPDSGSVARYGFMRFNRVSGALQVDVVCVLPQSDQARQDAAAYFRKYDPLASSETLNAARGAGLSFSWEDGGDVWCEVGADTLYCDGGVHCAMMARSPVNAPSYSRKVASATGRSDDMMAVCDNGCDVHDFIYYCGGGGGTVDYGGGGGGNPAATLVCPETVERGTEGTCTATTSGTIVSWYFDGDEGVDVPRVNDIVSNVWRGVWAGSGTVQVVVNEDGVTDTATKYVRVTPRTTGWTFATDSKDQGSAGMKVHPDTASDLGYTTFDPESTDVVGHYTTIDGGPNDNYAYMTSMHYAIATIHINSAAMSPGTAFVLAQAVTGGTGYCTRGYVTNTLPGVVRAHEGTAHQSNSHTARYDAQMNALNAAQIVEAVTGAGSVDPADIRTRLASTMLAAEAYSALLDDPPPTLPCGRLVWIY